MRRRFGRAMNALFGRLEVFRFGLENVFHVFLRVAVDDGEPGALHLHHDLVPLAEIVIGPVQVDRDSVASLGASGSGFSKLLWNRPRNTSLAIINWYSAIVGSSDNPRDRR